MIRDLVNHAPMVLLLALGIILFGTISYATLPREAAPDVKISVVMVTTRYVGVAPSDVESLVTIPLENELAGVKDLKTMKSTSAEGVSIISLEFQPDVVIEDALQRVRDRVNRARPKLPNDVDDPEVREISISDLPILIVTLAGDADEEVLKTLAKNLQDEVNHIKGVLDTTISGGLTRQIRVQVDPRRLAVLGLGFDDVIGAVQNENVNIPGGEVKAGDASFLVRVPGQFTDPRQIETVAVKRVGDRPVFIRDIGRVVDGYADRTTYARMNGRPAVSLAISKRAGASIVEIGDQVKAEVARQAKRWPKGVTYKVLADQSERIRDMVSDLENNIITALLLVVGVLLFSMGLRNSLFVALAIPISMLVSFAVIQALGFTLNMIVLFALILALGMLVDNGIVIVENIYRHMEEGADLFTASIEGTGEVATAVAASTATTVAAFLPLVFWTGIMGEFMGYLPKTVIIVLTASLVVAVVIQPVATSRFMKEARARQGRATRSPHRFMRIYRSMLEWSITHRYRSAGIGLLSLVGTFVTYGFLNHGTEFLPNTEPDRATISVRTPEGTDLDSTDRIVRQIENVLAGLPNVETYVAETGKSGGGDRLAGVQQRPNQARITVDFLPDPTKAKPGEKVRVESTFDTINKIRAAVGNIPGAMIDVNKERMGPPVGAPIEVEVHGPDFREVGDLAARVKRAVAEIPGVTDLRDDYRVGRPEMRLRIDRGAAKQVGASTAAVASAVRTAVAGTKASTLRDGKDEYDIVVEVDPRYRDDLQDILALRIPGRLDTSPKTFQVPLSAVASYELVGGNGAIRHVDQDLVVTIDGDVAEGYNENEVRSHVQDLLAKLTRDGTVPNGFSLRLGGANDEQHKARVFLGKAFLWAIALIAFVSVTQFNNFRFPAIVMASVVLSLIGVLWGLVLTGTPFDVIMTGIGVISLAGVVVNNAIVLLDYVEKLRKRGLCTHDALVRAGMTRFRPVMLTAVTTVLGLVPMAIGVSIDFRHLRLLVGGQNADFWGPMAIAVIFGLSFATVLTLVMVPTFYSITEDLREYLARVKIRRTRTIEASMMLLGLGLLAPRAAHGAPVTLQQAWKAAEAANLDLAVAHEQTVQAETLRGQALAVVSPKVSAQGSYTINSQEISLDMADSGQAILNAIADGLDAAYGSGAGEEFRNVTLESQPIVIQEKFSKAGSLSVVQPLFNGQALPLLSGARHTVAAARLDEDEARQQLHASVARAYYGLATARQAEKLAQQAVESAEDHLELAKREVAAGSAPPRTVLQAELALSQAMRAAAQAHDRVVAAGLLFARITGLDPDTEVVLPDPVQVPDTLEDALHEVDARPDLLAAQHRVQAARAAWNVQRASWLPSIEGRFTYSYSDTTGFSGKHVLWMAVAEANWTLWDGGARLALARKSASQQRQAELMELSQRAKAEQDVRVAWQKLQTSVQAMEAAQAEVKLAERNLELAEASLKAGTAAWIEVEDARLNLVQSRLAALTERANRDLAAIDLRVAMGAY